MKRKSGFAWRLRLRPDRNKKHYACKKAKARIKLKQLRRMLNVISLHGDSDAANASKKRSRQKKSLMRNAQGFTTGVEGLEPSAHGFGGRCSTN